MAERDTFKEWFEAEEKKRKAPQQQAQGINDVFNVFSDIFGGFNPSMKSPPPAAPKRQAPEDLVVACPSCGQKNRVRRAQPARPVCGNCRAPLS